MVKERRRTRHLAKMPSNPTSERSGVRPVGRRLDTALMLPAGEPDIEALLSITREWLAPRLVEKFLRTHGIEPSYSAGSPALDDVE